MKKIVALQLIAVLFAGCVSKTTVVSNSEGNVQPLAPSTIPKERQRAQAHDELGRAYLSSGQLDTALEEAKIAIESDPKYANAHDLEGLIYLTLGEMPKALASLSRANKLAPDNSEILNDYGWVLCQNGQEQKALVVLQRAINDPLNRAVTRPYTNAGICSLRLKRSADAESYFLKAIDADPSNGQPIYLLAQMRYEQGRFVEARTLIDKLWKVNTPGPESLWLAIRIANKTKNRLDVGKYSSQLLQRFPDSPEGKKVSSGAFE